MRHAMLFAARHNSPSTVAPAPGLLRDGHRAPGRVPSPCRARHADVDPAQAAGHPANVESPYDPGRCHEGLHSEAGVGPGLLPDTGALIASHERGRNNSFERYMSGFCLWVSPRQILIN
jgi:hypothetical protein